jgi:hypothetical protein
MLQVHAERCIRSTEREIFARQRTAGDSEGDGEGNGVMDDVSLGVDVCDGDEVTLSEGLLLGVSLGVGVAVAVDVALSVTVYLCTTIPQAHMVRRQTTYTRTVRNIAR